MSTQSFGYTNIENKASYSGDAIGFGASGGVGNSSAGGVNWDTPLEQSGPTGPAPGPVTSNGLGPSGFWAAGTSSEASGTTYATVSPGKITVRDDADTGHDSTADLNRDAAIANGAVQNTFDAQKVQNNLAVQQAVGQVGMQVIGEAANYLREQALEAKAEAERAYESAALAQDEAGMAKAQADISAADQNGGHLFRATAAEYKDPFLYGNKDGSLTPEQKALPGSTANPAAGLAIAGGLVTAGLGPEIASGAATAISYGQDLFAAYKAAQAAYSFERVHGS